MVNRSLFVSSMFNGTFSTNRLYRAIGVLSGKYDTTGRGRGILFWPNYRPHSLLALAGFNSFKFIRSDVDICTSFTHKIATAAHNPSLNALHYAQLGSSPRGVGHWRPLHILQAKPGRNSAAPTSLVTGKDWIPTQTTATLHYYFPRAHFGFFQSGRLRSYYWTITNDNNNNNIRNTESGEKSRIGLLTVEVDRAKC